MLAEIQAMSRRKRVLLWLAVLVALAGVGLVGLRCATAPKHRLTAESAAQVRRGMTQAEVEAILGAPPGDHTGGRAFLWHHPMSGHGQIPVTWISAEVVVTAYFDDRSGLVAHCNTQPTILAQRPLFDRLRRWLGL